MPASTSKPGDVHNYLTLIKPLPKRINSSVVWKCKCKCGNIYKGPINLIRHGSIQSCGCKRVESAIINGKNNRKDAAISVDNGDGTRSVTILYGIWRNMLNRSHFYTERRNQNYLSIKVCDRWLNFKKFKKDVLKLDNAPKKELLKFNTGKSLKLSIDRIDNWGNYEPGNVKWSTVKEQARNRNSTVWVKYKGYHISLAEASELIGENYHTVYQRLFKYGKSYPRLTVLGKGKEYAP
jgi:hypothetical protein